MIKYVQIYGQRASGTNFLEHLVRNNISSVRTTYHFGLKHWFPCSKEDPNTYRTLEDSDDTLFIVLTRNVFDWTRSFYQKPWFCHPDLQKGTYSHFLRGEWSCYLPKKERPDLLPTDENVYITDMSHMEELLQERDPDTKKRFTHILRMRSKKLQTWHNLRRDVRHYIHIRYEDLAAHPFYYTQQIATLCNRSIRRTMFSEVNTYKGTTKKLPFKKHTYTPIKKEDLQWLHKELNWKIEKLFGYAQTDYEPHTNTVRCNTKHH